jgi:hypothetical protein
MTNSFNAWGHEPRVPSVFLSGHEADEQLLSGPHLTQFTSKP